MRVPITLGAIKCDPYKNQSTNTRAKTTYGISSDSILDVSGELPLVGFLVILKKVLHVVGHVDTEDVLAVNLCVELLGLVVVAGETLGGVRNVDATVDSSLHGAENSGTGGGPGKASVEAGAEGTGSVGGILDHEVIAVNLGLALVNAVQVQLLEDLKAGQQIKTRPKKS